MAFFVGGQLVLAAVVVPVARAAGNGDLIGAVARRFGYGTLVATGVLVATGSAMATHLRLWSDGTLQLKLALVIITGVLIAGHTRRPTWHALEGGVFALSLAIVWLGLRLAHG
jgi:uncharacterized membrane protein